MSIKADFHLHSNFSSDSDASMESMILRGIELGLDTMCFTEHHDEGFPKKEQDPDDLFLLHVDSYLYELLTLKERYADKIRVLFGVELGIQASLTRSHLLFSKSHEFDFIIASSHLCNGKDPYYPAFYEGRSTVSAYEEYFLSLLENVKTFKNFDVYGHLDYVVRYGPTKNENYSYANFADIFDEILTTLIDHEKGIELNTCGFKYGLGEGNPCTDVVRRYKELGGEIITIGSDAHTPDYVASEFDHAAAILKSCGFKYYTVFEGRMPQFNLI